MNFKAALLAMVLGVATQVAVMEVADFERLVRAVRRVLAEKRLRNGSCKLSEAEIISSTSAPS